MPSLSDQPMTDFPVRPLRFEVPPAGGGDRTDVVIWSRTKPEFSVFMNALAMHVPHFEQFLVSVLLEARSRVSSTELRRDITAIMGQEAHHALNFRRFNQLLRERYAGISAHDDASIAYFKRRTKDPDLRSKIGFTAGYETFTFLAGMIILANHDRWFADADPTLKALWVWHQVEEVEHGAVAFEVWKELYGQHEWLRKFYILQAAAHIAVETIRLYPRMAAREGWLSSPARIAKTMGFAVEMMARLVWAALPVFSSRYNPRNHPIATSGQDPIQIAWRRYESRGGNVLAIDHDRMREIMGLAPQA
jgi:predicted metal-dependent hydrolase